MTKTDFGIFFCDRSMLDEIHSINQRRILIYNYCNRKFNYYNQVDLFYNNFKGNGILLFFIMCLIIPLCIYWISFLSKNYLSLSIEGFINKIQLKPTLASIIIVSYTLNILETNSYNTEKSTDDGILNVLGCIFGGIIFNLSLTLANVIKKSGDIIRIPKNIFFKDLGYLFFCVVFIMICGYLNVGVFQISISLLILYFVYVVISYFLGEKYLQHIDVRLTLVKTDFSGFEISDDENDMDIDDDDEEDNVANSIDEDFDNLVEHNEEEKNDLKLKITKKDDYILDSKDKKMIKGIKEIFYDFCVVHSVEFISSSTICSSFNKKMDSGLRKLIIFFSYIHIYFLVNRLIKTPMASNIINILFLLLILIAEFALHSKYKYYILEISGLLAALNFVSLIFGLLLDMSMFLAFYFNVDNIIIFSVLIAMESFLINFFTLGEISKNGKSLVAALSVYSSQITNILVPFPYFLILRSYYYDSNFSVFNEDRKENIVSFFSHYYIIMMFFSIVVLIIITTSFVMMKRGVLNKLFSNLLIGFFSVFATASFVFTVVSEFSE